jgi:hypothetical protein
MNNEMNHAFVGTNDSSGDASIPNRGNGIDIVGATGTIMSNCYVRNNGRAGLEINGSTATGNDFQFGTLFNNGKLGISVGDNIGTDHANHAVSTGGGAGAGATTPVEGGLNHPLLSSAVANGMHTLISGTFRGDSGETFDLEFYESNGADPSGFGQGERSVDSTQVTTDNSGNASFAFNEGDTPEFGAATVYTAFAVLDNTDDMSEFSNAVKVSGASISGNVFNDANGNGKQDAGEKGLAKQIVFIDTKGTGVFDDDLDLFTTTNSNGNFTLVGAPTSTIHLLLSPASGFAQTTPNAKKPFYKLTITPLEHVGGLVFGEMQTKAKAAALPAAKPLEAASSDNLKRDFLDDLDSLAL